VAVDPTIVIAGACGVAGIGVVATGVAGVLNERRGTTVDAYLEDLDSYDWMDPEDLPDEFTQRLARPFVDRILAPTGRRIVSAVASITPRDHRNRIRTKLQSAGLDLTRRPEEIIAAQGVGFVLGLSLGVLALASGAFAPAMAIVILVLLTGVGAYGPMIWLSRRADERAAGIRSELPETLDLLAISVGAGLGLEGAMQVVVERSTGPLADEIARTLHEMGLGLSRKEALTNLKQRSNVEELSSFVQALLQADALGMPLSRVLKILAGEMRNKRRMWARERAAKLPVKILFPLVACIFPAVLVVVLGPAVPQIMEAFG
jgi:tight adherence protein C